ncbi:MAG: M48 family metallopeptidase [Oligoflexia bacterium]|nr:M48 family metallopeptidase [Oligoflexia bacterium]
MMTLFLSLLIIVFLFKLWLSLRNTNCVESNRAEVPKAFAERFAVADHHKAQDYSLAKLRSRRLFMGFETLVLMFWTVGGGLALLDENIRTHLFATVSSNEILFGIYLALCFSAVNFLLDLPEEIYTTFSIEKRFGFNRTTIKTFISDHLKGIILGMVIGLPLFSFLIWAMLKVPYWWPWAFATLTLFQLFLMWIYPMLIAPLFNKFTPMPEGPTKEAVKKLLSENHFPYQGLYVMDASRRSTHGNAYFTGFGKSRRIVFYDTLLESLTPSEVVAVLAHEIAHFKYKHILKSLLISIISSALGMWLLWKVSTWSAFYHSFHITVESPAVVILLFSMIIPPFTFFLTPLFSWYSRKNEYEADRFAATAARAEDLISALVKMYRDNASTLTPDSLYALFYYSHPTAMDRIAFLQSLSSRPKY